MSGSRGLCYEHYQTGDANEWLLRIGAAGAPAILFVPPLFEEMNRTRGFLTDVMRALAAKGYGCWLPDLPGTGESERRLEACSWDHWRSAVRDVGRHVREQSGGAPGVVGLRGGALLDDMVEAQWVWRLAPVTGSSLARDLERSSLVAPADQSSDSLDFAGYRLRPDLLESLRQATPPTSSPLRSLRLANDPAVADDKLAGPPLWRRSEPGKSPELASAAVADIEQWIATCAAC